MIGHEHRNPQARFSAMFLIPIVFGTFFLGEIEASFRYDDEKNTEGLEQDMIIRRRRYYYNTCECGHNVQSRDHNVV